MQVIASNDINDELNKQDTPVFWPERRYVWGTAEAFNPDHSDLLHLRCAAALAQLMMICVLIMGVSTLGTRLLAALHALCSHLMC
jgi:hypothetical protein